MLIDFSRVPNCYLVTGYTDLRKGTDGLAAVVTDKLELSLFEESVFLFCGRRTNPFKALWFDGEGFYLYDDRQVCSCCKSQMERLGQKIARTELNFISFNIQNESRRTYLGHLWPSQPVRS